MNKESMINVLKYNFFLEPDGHTIFNPRWFIDNGLTRDFVGKYIQVHKSGNEPKEKIIVNGKVVDELSGVYELDILYGIAELIDADTSVTSHKKSNHKLGRSNQAEQLVKAIHNVVHPEDIKETWINDRSRTSNVYCKK